MFLASVAEAGGDYKTMQTFIKLYVKRKLEVPNIQDAPELSLSYEE